ncbi:MAG: DUF115 domain-containing protein [Treponema sp.]|nr:DUF115 domain-containing protein [Treponema sp.]
MQEKYVNCKIVVLHIENIPLPKGYEKIPVLYNISPAEIQGFLETNITETNAEKIHILEWRHSLNYYREKYVNILSQVVDYIKRLDAGARTTSVFGKRWVRNFFRNLNNVNKSLLYRQADVPVIITGSGPGLEQALPVIKEVQDTCLIIAASSSVMALSNSGVKADIVISTDGGNWALHHLYHSKSGIPALAVNLCAALPSQYADTPLLLMNDGSFWQSIILHELELPSVLIPQKGTVTASAVELAMLLSKNNVYLAGLDFSFNDIRTHVKPYSFDNILFGKSSRFTPFYNECYTRSSLISHGGSMDIYSTWFKTQLDSWPKKIFSINESSLFQTGSPLDIKNRKKKDLCFKTISVNGDTNIFCKRGVSVLLDALTKNEFSDNLKNELLPLLGQELENEIKKMAKGFI